MVSSASIAEYLDGIDFPATKDEIVQYAEDQNAPFEVLDTLQDMVDPPDGSYYSMASIWDAVGTVTLGGAS